jgi:hypothetical protein
MWALTRMIARPAIAVADLVAQQQLCRPPFCFHDRIVDQDDPTAVRARISARERPWLHASALGPQLVELGSGWARIAARAQCPPS